MRQIRLVKKEVLGEDPIMVDRKSIVRPLGNFFSVPISLEGGGFIEIRNSGEFSGMALFLPGEYNY
jgi:hypothetical protein